MRKLIVLILIIEFTAACGGGGGGGSGGTRRQNPVTGPGATPTPSPIGGSLRVTAGTVTSGASGVAMRASVSGGNTRVVTSAAGVAAEISVGVPAASR